MKTSLPPGIRDSSVCDLYASWSNVHLAWAWDLPIIHQGDSISHITRTSFLIPRLPEEPGETLIAAGSAPEPKRSCLPLAVFLSPFPQKRERWEVWYLVGHSYHTCARMTLNLQGSRTGLGNTGPFLLSPGKGSSSRPLTCEDRHCRGLFAEKRSWMKGWMSLKGKHRLWQRNWFGEGRAAPKADQHTSGNPGSCWQPKHQANQHLFWSGWERHEYCWDGTHGCLKANAQSLCCASNDPRTWTWGSSWSHTSDVFFSFPSSSSSSAGKLHLSISGDSEDIRGLIWAVWPLHFSGGGVFVLLWEKDVLFNQIRSSLGTYRCVREERDSSGQIGHLSHYQLLSPSRGPLSLTCRFSISPARNGDYSAILFTVSLLNLSWAWEGYTKSLRCGITNFFPAGLGLSWFYQRKTFLSQS